MGADYAVHRPCEVKDKLGEGDSLAGEGELLRLLKARERAKALKAIALQQGKDVQTMTAMLNETDDEGQTVSREIAYADLVAEARALRGLESACEGCAANALQRSFGCHGAVKYPVTKRAEEWLMQQVQTFDTVAGPYVVAAFEDGDEGLPMIQSMRERGLFESTHPVRKVVKAKLFSKVEIDSDSVFETFMGRGAGLEPGYCMMLLLGLGAICLDGEPATSAEAFVAILEMENVGDRQASTTFAFRPDPDPGVLSLQCLLRAMFHAWQNDVVLLIDA
jgi:hypothetical protein